MEEKMQQVRRSIWAGFKPAAVAAITMVLSLPLVCAGQTAQEKGRAVAEEADRRYGGYGDARARLRMILRNQQGQVSERELRTRTLEVADGVKSLCIFDSPADVKHTVLLTHTHTRAPDDQWLYLPALKRVRRIAAQNRSGSFMSSEFSYEDIATDVLEKYTYTWLRDERYDEQDCYVIERRPADSRDSGYTRQTVWIEKADYRMLKVEYYDRKDSLLKTLTLKAHRKYLDKFWRPHDMSMVNHQTGKSTQLIWSEIAFDTGLTENDFNQASLTTIR
jgi:outer membrane lipoprotein-sorting protein